MTACDALEQAGQAGLSMRWRVSRDRSRCGELAAPASRCARSARRGRRDRGPWRRAAGSGRRLGSAPPEAGRRAWVDAVSSSSTSRAVSTSLAPWRIRAWQPLDCGEDGTGSANTSRLASTASRAVISEPDCSMASTTSVPRVSPAMMRLRCGKFSGGVPSGSLQQPSGGDAPGQRKMAARVDLIEPGGDHRDGAARAAERTFVRCAVDAQRQPGDDGESGAAQMRREGAGVLPSPARWRAGCRPRPDAGA